MTSSNFFGFPDEVILDLSEHVLAKVVLFTIKSRLLFPFSCFLASTPIALVTYIYVSIYILDILHPCRSLQVGILHSESVSLTSHIK